MTDAHPTVLQTVLDCREPRRLADFYRDLVGWEYRPGDETPTDGEDWLVLAPGPSRPAKWPRPGRLRGHFTGLDAG